MKTRPLPPPERGGVASLAAEEVLQRGEFANSGIVLRLAGIYGPGRVPRAADLQAGKPIDAPADGYLNLIHVDDAARIVLLAEEKSATPELFLVSDGNPVIRREYYEHIARILGSPSPVFVAPAASSPAAARAAADKRVSPAKLFKTLAPQLVYPSYKEGLAAILGSG